MTASVHVTRSRKETTCGDLIRKIRINNGAEDVVHLLRWPVGSVQMTCAQHYCATQPASFDCKITNLETLYAAMPTYTLILPAWFMSPVLDGAHVPDPHQNVGRCVRRL